MIREALMNRQRVLELLAEHKSRLADRYGVSRLAVFGSMARDAATADSDVDVLVAFDGPATSERYFECCSTWRTCWGVPSISSPRRRCERSSAPTSIARRCMSKPPPEREWRFYLDDMIGFAERVP